MKARYDLRYRAASFDFFTWMTHVRVLGATEIVFQSKEYGPSAWTPDQIERRFETIVKPGPTLMGLPSREAESDDDGDLIGSHMLGDLGALNRPDFQRLKAVKPAGSARYTVTLRKVQYKKFRNSDEKVWRQFAREIGAVVIPDYADQPISLHDRMSLYAGAEMNFGVMSGPVSMLFYSDYPLMMLDCNKSPVAWERHGVPVGSQLPWFRKNQSLVWENPTLQVLIRHFRSRSWA